MTAFDIGILAGSGPEAGIDLWQAVLDERRRRRGEAFRGDLDAPSVMVRSVPELGLSMDLARHGERVAAVVLEHAAPLDGACAAWTIACNTINRYADRIHAAGLGGGFVSFPDAVERWLDARPPTTVGLLGAHPVTELGPDSAYAHLADRLRVPDPERRARLHALIEDVKRLGPADPDVRTRFASLCGEIDADRLLMACTELPLVADADDRLVDVTRLVAAALLDAIEASP
ncbi:MAG: aspartate/glutamate racemase family protein [Actinomycetota bacterium]